MVTARAERGLPPAVRSQASVRTVARRERVGGRLLLLSTVLVLIVPVLLTPITLADLTSLAPFLSFGLVALSGIRLAALYASSAPKPFDGMFWIFVYVFIGLGALAQILAGRFPVGSAYLYASEDYVAALVLIWVGVIGHLVGTRLYLPSRARRRFRRAGDLEPAGRVRTLTMKRVFIVALIGLTATGATVARAGVGALFESRESARVVYAQDDDGVRAWMNDGAGDSAFLGTLSGRLTLVPTFLALYLLLYRRKNRPTGVRRPRWETPTLLLLVGANVLINNPFSNSRAWFGGITIALAAIYFPFYKIRHFRVFLLVAVSALLIVFPYGDYFRRTDKHLVPAFSPGETLFTDGSYSGFQMAMNAPLWVEQNGHTMGRQLLGSVFFFVPRAVWATKPTDTGNQIGGIGELREQNRAAPLWAEFYVDFGVVGVFVGFLGYGMFTAFIDRRYRSARTQFDRAAVPAVAPQIWYLLRGSLAPALAAIGPLIFVLVAVFPPRARRSEPLPDQTLQEPRAAVGPRLL